MTVKELIEKLSRLPQNSDVFFRAAHLTGNIKPVDIAMEDTRGFFGISLPCVILDEVTVDLEEEE